MLLYLLNKVSILPRKQNQSCRDSPWVGLQQDLHKRTYRDDAIGRDYQKIVYHEATLSAQVLCSRKCNTHSSESLWHYLQQIPALPYKKPKKRANLLCRTRVLITERNTTSALGLRTLTGRQREEKQCELCLRMLKHCVWSMMSWKHFLFGLRLRIHLAQSLEDPETWFCDATFLQLLRLETWDSSWIFFPQTYISKSYWLLIKPSKYKYFSHFLVLLYPPVRPQWPTHGHLCFHTGTVLICSYNLPSLLQITLFLFVCLQI